MGTLLKKAIRSWEYSSVVYMHVPSMRKALGLIPSNTHAHTQATGNQLVGLVPCVGYVLGSAWLG